MAISANSGGTYEGLRILRNRIHHTHGTGEGMYLGCNNDGCRIANSLIEGNYIHGTSRTGTNDVGAYRFSTSGNPGWQITAGFKTSGNIVRPNPPTNVTAQ